jgi:hypothetical protein
VCGERAPARNTAPGALDAPRLQQESCDGPSGDTGANLAPRRPAVEAMARRPLQAPVDRFPGQNMFDVVKNGPRLTQCPQLCRSHRVELAVRDRDDHGVVTARD